MAPARFGASLRSYITGGCGRCLLLPPAAATSARSLRRPSLLIIENLPPSGRHCSRGGGVYRRAAAFPAVTAQLVGTTVCCAAVVTLCRRGRDAFESANGLHLPRTLPWDAAKALFLTPIRPRMAFDEERAYAFVFLLCGLCGPPLFSWTFSGRCDLQILRMNAVNAVVFSLCSAGREYEPSRLWETCSGL